MSSVGWDSALKVKLKIRKNTEKQKSNVTLLMRALMTLFFIVAVIIHPVRHPHGFHLREISPFWSLLNEYPNRQKGRNDQDRNVLFL